MLPNQINEELLKSVCLRLARAIRSRKVSQAKRIVDDWIDQLDTLPLTQRSSIFLIALCARSIDFYGPYLKRVERAVLRFKQIPLGELTIRELALLGIAEGLVQYHRERYVEAKALLDQAKVDADRAEDAELITVTRYNLGRVLLKLTNYESALESISNAKERDLTAGNLARAAAIEMDEGWLHFLLGDVKEAQQRLDHARAILAEQSSAFIDQANALSFQGRLYREDGQYQKALDCYLEAIPSYGEYDPGYRNVARCRRNIAVIYRIMARDLMNREKISQDIRPQIAAQVEELRSKAFAELERAREIYGFDPDRHNHGLGILHITRALLHFDADELEPAAEEAHNAYEFGTAKEDYIVMAEARVIQSGLALEGYRGVIHASRALKLANEAIQLAEHTDRHRRLIARAYICKGYALLESPHNDTDGARRCWEEAKTHLVPEDRDYLRDSLDSLEKEVQSREHVTSFSIQLTHNEIAGASLVEITEIKVEEPILRHVYERSGRSIPRAAKELRTGPRKVRNAVSIFKFTEESLKKLESEGIDKKVLELLASLKNREIKGRASFERLVKERIGSEQTNLLRLIRKHVHKSVPH